MKKFLIKTALYTVLILIALELLVRALHLYTEDPPRFIDEYGVEKRVPGHNGYAVTGNRNQNFSEFNINSSGFNSYREYTPTKEDFEIALIGDSFIEGFHQDYDESTGKKIEIALDTVEVYEYGYAGYDLANQMHLINAYQDQFELIDEIIIYLNYESDLNRGVYEPNKQRIAMLRSTVFKIRDNIKLLAYGSKIGIVDPIKNLITGKAFQDTEQGYETNKIEIPERKEKEYLENFKSLVSLYGFDKCKTTILLDSRKTSESFLEYCDENNIKYLDFAPTFESSKKPVTLIYDHHWNNHGRELIASVISNYMMSREVSQDCQ
ncbi:MAG: hypothetical protein VX798_03360 [Bacteroidota bacterium]|uniref:SGNH/GDSL hydrolase family protein n=1 Tax=Flagellimonas profundi TaxID=2915620 RepID=A0ABS3FBG7_9FLAO|nr:hypothetical protein [Allomuricauda profundi]MBO0340506.1 hypothetical protein [Allomuricauda profundi]MEC7770192.1 hypothetical protein [Bacteroidota bacterium]